MQDQDLSLELPGGLGAQLWRDHHHAFPDGRALDLHKEEEGGVKREERPPEGTAAGIGPPTFFRAKEAVWPPRTSFTGILFRWMDLTAMDMKLPRGSGPSSMVSFRRMSPRNVVPDTTVPTPCHKHSRGLTRIVILVV